MPAPKEITPKEWQRIIAVFAKHDGRIRPAANELGWPYARAARRYHRGYESIGYPPIKTILARDAFSADEIRAERQLIERGGEPGPIEAAAVTVLSDVEQRRVQTMVRREDERERARQDAIKSRAEEAQLVSINRRNAVALNAVTAQVLKGAVALSGKIQRELEAEAHGESAMSLNQKLHLVRAAASIARFNAEASMMAVKAERLVMGAPIEASAEGNEETGTLDEAAAWIDACSKALARARSRGLIASGS